jgi:hypothetical protein
VLLDKFVGTPDGLADGVFEGPAVSKKLGTALGTSFRAPEGFFVGLCVG